MTNTLHPGDCLDVIPRLITEGVVCDAVVTDPPYGLEFMGQEWDRFGGRRISKPGIGSRPTEWVSNAGWNQYRCKKCGHLPHGGSPCQCAIPDIRSADDRWHHYQQWCEQWARTAYEILRPGAFLVAFGGTRTYHRLACAIEDAGFVIQDTIAWLYGSGFPKRRDMLKPAIELIVLAYKPGGKRTMQVDECRIGTESTIRDSGKQSGTRAFGFGHTGNSINGSESGRWPANVIHDGSEEVTEGFPDAPGQSGIVTGLEPSTTTRNLLGLYNERPAAVPRMDSGSAARFFYCAKADKQDRWGSRHPTVKPVELMKWLVALVTPPGGLVLDPFAGSGATGVAALATGRDCILIERESAYVADIRERLAFYEGGETHSMQAKNRNRQSIDHGPLFAEPFDAALDSALSYEAAIQAIGERVKAGEPLPNSGYFGDKP